jgi:hypothetical protein
VPSGWLGIVLAGVVWTELREASYEGNVAKIAEQIRALADAGKAEAASDAVGLAHEGAERAGTGDANAGGGRGPRGPLGLAIA